MSTEPTTRNIVVTRVFNAPVERVWSAWRDSDQMMGWWGPTGFTVPVAQMDFREGGTSLICMRAPQEWGGQDYYNTWAYSRIVPMERIEFTMTHADSSGAKVDPADVGMPPGTPQDVRHQITFNALSASQTEMTVTEYGYTSDEVLELSKAGLEQCLDKMQVMVEGA